MGLRSKEDVIQYVDDMKDCVFDGNMMIVLNILIIFKKLKEKLKENSRIYREYDKIKS
jgi:hypothetical protein